MEIQASVLSDIYTFVLILRDGGLLWVLVGLLWATFFGGFLLGVWAMRNTLADEAWFEAEREVIDLSEYMQK